MGTYRVNKIKAVVFAYHALGYEGLNALIRNGFEVSIVFTHADGDEVIWWPSVSEFCKKNNIRYEIDSNLKCNSTFTTLLSLKPDIFFSFYYRNIIPIKILRLAKFGGYNLHGSLLPKYRGRCPVNWQLINGEEKSGLTLHKMGKNPDTGVIIHQSEIFIHPDQTALGLYKQMVEISQEFLDKSFYKILDEKYVGIKQDESEATTYGSRQPDDGLIDWSWTSRRVHNLVRAVTHPYPGAFTYSKHKVMIWKTKVIEETSKNNNHGTIVGENIITCSKGTISVLEATDSDGNLCDFEIGDTFNKGNNLD
jgi:UDP-4-amino-4-deoxy-L-arabinose formyltransferase/UDP-glucuronic acid dehydrogenase (UDP-4-keto-hexauronic acid decarboxylating)